MLNIEEGATDHSCQKIAVDQITKYLHRITLHLHRLTFTSTVGTSYKLNPYGLLF